MKTSPFLIDLLSFSIKSGRLKQQVPLLPAPPRSLPGLPHMCRRNPQEDFAMSSFSDSHTFFFVCLSQLSSYVILFSDICLIILYKTRQGFFIALPKFCYCFSFMLPFYSIRHKGRLCVSWPPLSLSLSIIHSIHWIKRPPALWSELGVQRLFRFAGRPWHRQVLSRLERSPTDCLTAFLCNHLPLYCKGLNLHPGP